LKTFHIINNTYITLIVIIAEYLMRMRIGLIITGFFVLGNIVMAQSSDKMTRSQYFDSYKEMAIHEMHRSGVPASITLAQGALESGDGNSRLARNANNHFGIKCHEDWNGRKVYEDDDAKNECFRKYQSVEESYRDHSDYLKTKTRYAFLFELDITNYKGWARGLKKAGYATSPTYAESLVRIIEEFGLQKYDREGETAGMARKRVNHRSATVSTRNVMERNRVKYLLAGAGDTFESITDEFGKLPWEIRQYNDVNSEDTLVPGQVVFIQPKRNKAEVGKNVHLLKQGETMYTVSQLYAIKLSRLYALNNMNQGTKPTVGDVLQLRKPLKRSALRPVLNDSVQGGNEEEDIKVELNLE
jgi:LysM repeat protein